MGAKIISHSLFIIGIMILMYTIIMADYVRRTTDEATIWAVAYYAVMGLLGSAVFGIFGAIVSTTDQKMHRANRIYFLIYAMLAAVVVLMVRFL